MKMNKKILILGATGHGVSTLVHALEKMKHPETTIVVVDDVIDEMPRKNKFNELKKITLKEIKREPYFQQRKVHPKHKTFNKYRRK